MAVPVPVALTKEVSRACGKEQQQQPSRSQRSAAPTTRSTDIRFTAFIFANCVHQQMDLTPNTNPNPNNQEEEESISSWSNDSDSSEQDNTFDS